MPFHDRRAHLDSTADASRRPIIVWVLIGLILFKLALGMVALGHLRALPSEDALLLPLLCVQSVGLIVLMGCLLMLNRAWLVCYGALYLSDLGFLSRTGALDVAAVLLPLLPVACLALYWRRFTWTPHWSRLIAT